MTETLTKRDLVGAIDHAQSRIIASVTTKAELRDSIQRIRDLILERLQVLHTENEALKFVFGRYIEHQNSQTDALEQRLKVLERELLRTQSYINDLSKTLHR